MKTQKLVAKVVMMDNSVNYPKGFMAEGTFFYPVAWSDERASQTLCAMLGVPPDVEDMSGYTDYGRRCVVGPYAKAWFGLDWVIRQTG